MKRQLCLIPSTLERNNCDTLVLQIYLKSCLIIYSNISIYLGIVYAPSIFREKFKNPRLVNKIITGVV